MVEEKDPYYKKFKELFEEFGIAFVDKKEKSIFVDGEYIFENYWFEKKHLDFIEAHEAAHVILGHDNASGRNLKEERAADYFAILILEELGKKAAANVGKEEFLTRNGLLFENTKKTIDEETQKKIRKFFRTDEEEKLLREQLIITESRVSDMKEKYPEVPEDVFNYFVNHDPAGNQKYLDWMLSAYENRWNKSSSTINLHIVNLVTAFHNLSNRLTPEFIKEFFSTWRDSEYQPNQKIIKNPKDLYSYDPTRLQVLSEILAKLNTKPTKSEIKKIIKKDIDKILFDDNWIVISPKTHQASCFYGANTRWCTAAKNKPETYNNYVKKGKLFYIINNNTNEKYAIFVRELGDIEIYDGTDDPIGDVFPDVIWDNINNYLKNIGYNFDDPIELRITTNQDDEIDLDTLIDFDNEF